MEILKFDKEKKVKYNEFINKYNDLKEFMTLKINNFNVGDKEIYLVIKKNLFSKCKILAYSIIEKDLKYIYMANSISKKYSNDGSLIFISDFMVKRKLRNQGIGKMLARHIICEEYQNKDIILQPDEDGFWFWKKFGFINDNISEHETWIKQKN